MSILIHYEGESGEIETEIHLDVVNLGSPMNKPSPDIVKIVFSLIICVLGLFGNLVAIFVILVLKEYQKSVTHWYVLQLAIADSLFLLTLPFKVSEDLNLTWIYPEWMCKAKETVLFLNYYASILFLVVMSVDRYIAVCHTFSDFLQRLRKRTTAFVIAIIIWSISLLLCIPVMLYSFKVGSAPNCKCSYEFPDEQNETSRCIREGFGSTLEDCLEVSKNVGLFQTEEIHCRSGINISISSILEEGSGDGTVESGSGSGSGEVWTDIHASCHYWDKSVGWIIFLSFNFAVMFILPLIIMVACYGLIIARLSATRMTTTNTPTSASFSHVTMGSGSQKFRKKSSSRSDKDRRRVTIMCAALVGSFVACWLPFHAIHLAKVAGIRTGDKDLCDVLPVIGTLLAYLNSALNPYLYSLLGTNFSRRWNSASRTLRRSIRRGSSSSGVGTVRFTKKKSGREGSSSNTATVITKVYKNANDKSYAQSEARKSADVTAYNIESQRLNSPAITQDNDPIGKGSPPPDYAESLTRDYEPKA